jgi:aminoglycoside phosphotransferase (APT) family kinase protein
MNDKIDDTEALSVIVGARVVAAEPCGWGFENRTVIATLEDGRRLVVQRINSRAEAGHKLHLARVLPDRLAAAGLRAPRLLAADPVANPPYAVREYLPGEPGASLMGTIEGAIQVARAMGALLPRLALVATAGAGLSDAWASPASLARHAQQQLDRCRPLLDDPACAALEATIAEVAARFAGRPAGFAHGDFCPVNVLVDDRRPTTDDRSTTNDRRPTTDDRRQPSAAPSSVVGGQRSVVGLLDLEFARIADPLFDAAWWGWVVRYHHPARWVHAWPQLLAAAGIADDEETAKRIGVIQRLRCLEMIDYCATTRTREAAEMWIERLEATLGWA